MKPISPKEAITNKGSNIPDKVIEAFNEAIVEKLSPDGVARVEQDFVITKIMNKMSDINRNDIFDNHWLDIEELFKAQGWKVEYDKPGYNEMYGACFKFIIPNKNAQI